MSLPVLSIVAFAIAIIISCVSQINVGFLSIAFAFIIGVFFGGMKVADVATISASWARKAGQLAARRKLSFTGARK